MIYEKDWFMRQITMAIQVIARLFFHRDTIEYEIEDMQNMSATDLLYKKLLDFLSQGKICEAEDYLYENYRTDNPSHLKLALDFYQRLNLLSDDELEEHNFSREEIEEGLQGILKLSNLQGL